jgi:hypothetical protein
MRGGTTRVMVSIDPGGIAAMEQGMTTNLILSDVLNNKYVFFRAVQLQTSRSMADLSRKLKLLDS